MRLKKISLRQALNILGAKNIELHKGFYYQSGFYELDNQLYYICTGDVRTFRGDNNELDIYYRTAEHRKDYTGGRNQFDFNQKLNDMGYSVCIAPKYKGNSM